MTFVNDVDDADDDGAVPFTASVGKVPGNGRMTPIVKLVDSS